MPSSTGSVPSGRWSAILDRLAAAYGPRSHASRPPLDELVMTVLSQNTSDINSGRAYRALRARYPGWRDVLEADPAELVDVIRAGGLANQKGPRIQAILRELDGSPHGLDLGWLADLPRSRRWTS